VHLLHRLYGVDAPAAATHSWKSNKSYTLVSSLFYNSMYNLGLECMVLFSWALTGNFCCDFCLVACLSNRVGSV